MDEDLHARVTSLDESIRVSTLAEPGLDVDEKRELIYGLTLAGISDSRLFEFLEADPDSCDAINPDVLVDPACPDRIKVFVLKNSKSNEIRVRLVTAPGLSKAIESAFDPEARDRETETVIRETYSDEAQEDEDKAFIEKYIETRLPFFVPRFEAQDVANPAHRLATLVGGFPFTSEKFPWPRDAAGRHKQPIVQLDLTQAGKVLQVDLGRGLLQVWANQIEGGWPFGKGWPWNKDDANFEVRVIPESSLGDPLDQDDPKDAPWLKSMEQLEKGKWKPEGSIAEHPCLMIHSGSRLLQPRISAWVHFGSMHIPRYDDSADMRGSTTFEFSDFFFSEFPTESIPNPDSGFIPNACYLGGYGGGHGGQNEAYPLRLRDGREARLLFNYRGEGDSYTAVNFSLLFVLDEDGPTFGFQYYRYA